jgi:putative membrane-bound dehydrogenase-like protein
MMRKWLWSTVAVAIAGGGFDISWMFVERAHTFEEVQRPALQVAEGFEVELVAARPLIEYPVMAGFDERGRLFVAENAGVNLPEGALLDELPNSVRLLEDTDSDGVFDRSSVFADRLTFSQGALWHDGALYVASPPSMWRLEDTDDDGVADVRHEIATGFDFTGNAADIHGPFLHPSGRLFWCHGRKGHEVYEGDRLVSKARGARIWTARPNGSDLQVFAGGGMDNPTELAFTDEGDIFGTVNLFQGVPRTDAIVHWVHGGVYPRTDQEQVLAEFKRTGALLPPATNLGHVAPAGILRYRSRHFGEEYRDNLFLAEFNTHRIMRVRLRRNGSSFSGESEVFLSSSSPDVHFTDLVEDADGSLLVIDTGGWFQRGCPTSGVAKPNVSGAIYRVRKIGAPALPDPRGVEIDWRGASAADLAALLGDDRFAVRDRAVAELAKRGNSVVQNVEKMLQGGGRQARLQAVWTLTRLDTEAARQAVRSALDDQDAGIRQAACRAVFTTRDHASAPRLTALLQDEAPAVRREAAAALGRLKEGKAVNELLGALARTDDDPMLEHALTYALIEIDQPQATALGLASTNPTVKHGSLMALSEMESGELRPQQVLPLLTSEAPELREAALMVIQRRDEWKVSVAALLDQWLGGAALPPTRVEVAHQLLVRFGGDAAVQNLIGRVLSRSDVSREQRRIVLGAAAQIPGVTMHPSWVQPLKALLVSDDTDGIMAASRVIQAAKGSGLFAEELERIGNDPKRDALLRVAALQALSGQDGPMADSVFDLLAKLFGSGETVALRIRSAEMLSRAKLSAGHVRRLVPLVEQAGPMELKALMPAFGQAKVPEDAGTALIQALSRSPGLFGLTAGDIRRSFRQYPEPVVSEAEALVAKLVQRERDRESHLSKLQAALTTGDPDRGRQVFRSGKGSCVACHRIEELGGGEVGPNLTTIGRSRSAQELLGAIVFPTEGGLARGYESYSISTRDGNTYFGTVSRETPDTVYVTQVTGHPIGVPRDQIEKMEPSPASLMPSGLDRLLSSQELGDLVAYLASLK